MAKKPKNTRKGKNRVFESMVGAATALKVNLEILKRAKRMGCPAFKPGNRIHEAELLPWIKQHGKELAPNAVTLRDQKLSEEVRKLRIKNDRDEKLVVSKAVVIQKFAELAKEIRPLLEQKLVNEWPSVVSGLDTAQARIYGKKLFDQVVELHHRYGRLWDKI